MWEAGTRLSGCFPCVVSFLSFPPCGRVVSRLLVPLWRRQRGTHRLSPSRVLHHGERAIRTQAAPPCGGAPVRSPSPAVRRQLPGSLCLCLLRLLGGAFRPSVRSASIGCS